MLSDKLRSTRDRLANYPTLLGLLSIFIWSTSGTIISISKSLPPYEMLMFVFLAAAFFPLTRALIQKRWSDFKAPAAAWTLAIFGIVLQQFMYVMAFQSIPAAEIDILVYLWPVMALVLSSLASNQKLNTLHLVAIIFGMMAIFILSFGQLSFISLSMGHFYALMCAVVWSLYTVFSRYYPSINLSMLGAGYLLGFFLSMVLHTQHEIFVTPDFKQIFTVLYIGIMGTICAMSLWTIGVSKGQSSKLIVCAYFKPVLSIALLYLTGFAELTPSLVVACFCVVIAGLISNIDVLENMRHRLPKLYLFNFRTYP